MGKSFLKITTFTLALLTGLNVQGAPRKKKTIPVAAVPAARSISKTPPPEVPPLAPGDPPLRARGAIVIDALSGKSIYEKNADEKQYPASTTKIMTALLVIEAGDLDKEVEITPEESKVGESSLNIAPGERFKRRQMLYGLMLKSANDVAYALGRDNAGTMAAFADKMTLRARELGATSTHFMNPHGLHHIEHYTTPRDLALIARAAMNQPLFRQIVATQKESWVTEFAVRELHNHNRLLTRYPGCTGVKTGYTNPAQQVLVSAALRQSREVIAVVMHTDKPGIWDDSMALLTYGFEHPPANEP